MSRACVQMQRAVNSVSTLADAVVSEEESVVKATAGNAKLRAFVKGITELYRTILKLEAACVAHPFCASGSSLEKTKGMAAEVCGYGVAAGMLPVFR